jgi:hypothetical protein
MHRHRGGETGRGTEMTTMMITKAGTSTPREVQGPTLGATPRVKGDLFEDANSIVDKFND